MTFGCATVPPGTFRIRRERSLLTAATLPQGPQKVGTEQGPQKVGTKEPVDREESEGLVVGPCGAGV